MAFCGAAVVDPPGNDIWPANAKRQICMRPGDALDLASWAGRNELCFGSEFVLRHEYNSHLKLCKMRARK